MKELLKKIQKGDQEAFKELVHLMENDLYRIGLTRLKNDDDIQDAIQNSMILVYQNYNKIRNPDVFKSWMIKVFVNECNKIYKTNKKTQELFTKSTDQFDYETGVYTESEINGINEKLNFEKLINSLSSDERMIVTMYYSSGLNCRQISDILNMKKDTVKSKLSRSVQKLKLKWGGENYEK